MVKSQFICLLNWTSGTAKEKLQRFKDLSVNKITDIYSEPTPTCDKVMQRIQPEMEDLRPSEQCVFYFPTSFVGNMDSEQLIRFVRFVTGSTCTPPRPILVCFNGSVGLDRAPRAATCCCILIIYTSYHSYQEFKKEFTAIQLSEKAHEMRLV